MLSNYNYFAIPGLLPKTDLQIILERVAGLSGYTVEQIKSRTRISEIAFVRHIFCWYAAKRGNSHTQIANILGRHRSAIAHSEKIIEGFIAIKDRRTLAIIEKL